MQAKNLAPRQRQELLQHIDDAEILDELPIRDQVNGMIKEKEELETGANRIRIQDVKQRLLAVGEYKKLARMIIMESLPDKNCHINSLFCLQDNASQRKEHHRESQNVRSKQEVAFSNPLSGKTRKLGQKLRNSQSPLIPFRSSDDGESRTNAPVSLSSLSKLRSLGETLPEKGQTSESIL